MHVIVKIVWTVLRLIFMGIVYCAGWIVGFFGTAILYCLNAILGFLDKLFSEKSE